MMIALRRKQSRLQSPIRSAEYLHQEMQNAAEQAVEVYKTCKRKEALQETLGFRTRSPG